MADTNPGVVNLEGQLPGGNVGAALDWAESERPHPDDPAGDPAGGWTKVGAGYQGGRQFTYGDGYYAPDGPEPWKQT